MKETKSGSQFRFWSYTNSAHNKYLRFNCGADYHCVAGDHNEKTTLAGKKTMCGKPTKHFFNTDDGDDCFHKTIGFDGKTPVVLIYEGKPFDSSASKESKKLNKEIISTLCPVCLAKAKKLS